MENLARFWKFLPDSGNFLLEIPSTSVKTDSLESVFRTNDLSLTGDLIGSVGFRVGSGQNLRVGRVIRLDGQP